MLDGDCLTFVEVRYRNSTGFSSPAATVDHRKQSKILRTAAMFVAGRQRYAGHSMRFDVFAVTGDTDDGIEWLQDAFRPNDSTL